METSGFDLSLPGAASRRRHSPVAFGTGCLAESIGYCIHTPCPRPVKGFPKDVKRLSYNASCAIVQSKPALLEFSVDVFRALHPHRQTSLPARSGRATIPGERGSAGAKGTAAIETRHMVEAVQIGRATARCRVLVYGAAPVKDACALCKAWAAAGLLAEAIN